MMELCYLEKFFPILQYSSFYHRPQALLGCLMLQAEKHNIEKKTKKLGKPPTCYTERLVHVVKLLNDLTLVLYLRRNYPTMPHTQAYKTTMGMHI